MSKNQAKLDRTRKLWYLLLRFSKPNWTEQESFDSFFWDFRNIQVLNCSATCEATRIQCLFVLKFGNVS